MASTELAEIVAVANSRQIAESGGGHNQKGIEFQKNWAVIQMFILEYEGLSDFLFLFEAIQDVAILDSVENPTIIRLYQIKKKDRGEWSWASLTKLYEPPDPSNPKLTRRKLKPLTEVSGSPIGKLHSAVSAIKLLNSSGRFISNAGCDLLLEDGSNAATSLAITLNSLPAHFQTVLVQALKTIQDSEDPAPDLSKLSVQKIDLPVDDPTTYTIGFAHKFLEKRSPRHAGQARSLVEGLLAKLAPLGAKTAACKNFDEMKSQHGYSRADFVAALADLEEIPDLNFYLNMWLDELHNAGMSFMEATSIRVASTGIYRRQVMGAPLDEEVGIIAECDAWLANSECGPDLLQFFIAGVSHLKTKFPTARRSELQAHFALRAITKCAVPS